MNPQSEQPPRQIDYISLIQWFGTDKHFKINLQDFHKGYRLIPYGGETFGIVEAKGYETYNAFSFNLNTLFEDEHHVAGKPFAIIKFNKEKYNLAKDKWSQYWTWKKIETKFVVNLKKNMALIATQTTRNF